MSELTIPVSLIIAQVDHDIATHDRMIDGYAQLLRDNKIEWSAATRQIFEVEATLKDQFSSLSNVLRLAGFREECQAAQEKVDAAVKRNKALDDDLYANCLLNGQKLNRVSA
jgi:hypothetical protein